VHYGDELINAHVHTVYLFVSGRWTHAAVLCLIETRKALEVKFGSARYKKKDVWKEVAAKINATYGLYFPPARYLSFFIM